MVSYSRRYSIQIPLVRPRGAVLTLLNDKAGEVSCPGMKGCSEYTLESMSPWYLGTSTLESNLLLRQNYQYTFFLLFSRSLSTSALKSKRCGAVKTGEFKITKKDVC